MARAVGIDLGTTNSVVSVLEAVERAVARDAAREHADILLDTLYSLELVYLAKLPNLLLDHEA